MVITLKEFMDKNNLSKKKVAIKTGLSESMISKLYNAKTLITEKTSKIFKDCYDLDLIDSFTEQQNKNEFKKGMAEMKKNDKKVEKMDINSLVSNIMTSNDEIKNQIMELKKQEEVNELKLALVMILTQDNSFFTRKDVVSLIHNLTAKTVNKEEKTPKVEVEIKEDNELELDEIEPPIYDEPSLEEDDEAEQTDNEIDEYLDLNEIEEENYDTSFDVKSFEEGLNADEDYEEFLDESEVDKVYEDLNYDYYSGE